MYHLSSGQIKAARAILSWSQEDLAVATGLAINTIRNIEMGSISPRSATNRIIKQIVENAGLEFTDGEGVKRRSDEVQIYQGADSCETFLDDMMQTIKKKGGDIAIIIKSQEMLARSCGAVACDRFDYLNELNALASIRCLMAEVPTHVSLINSCEFRTTAKQNICPLPCFIYGDKCAQALLDSTLSPRFVVYKTTSIVQSYRGHFLLLWEYAQALSASAGRQQEQRVKV